MVAKGSGRLICYEALKVSVFGFLKNGKSATRPRSPEKPLLGDLEFVGNVAQVIQSQHPAAGAMCLIALETFPVLMHATFVLSKERPDLGLPGDLNSFVASIVRAADEQTDEVEKRRAQWFYLAGQVRLAGVRAAEEPVLISLIAGMWIFLAKSGALLPKLLADNQLWTEREKMLFQHIDSPEEGVRYVLRYMLPDQLRKHPDIQALAREYNEVLPP